MKKRLIVGVSGASGAPLALTLMEMLRETEGWESHLIVTDAAKITLQKECGAKCPDAYSYLCSLADVVYDCENIGAAAASGSFQTEGMAVVPCSMKTLAGIANGYAADLLLRAADVTLKERRRLVLVTRETPLSLIHLKNMTAVTEAGAIVMPPVAGWYHGAGTLEEMQRQFCGRVLAQFGISVPGLFEWGG